MKKLSDFRLPTKDTAAASVAGRRRGQGGFVYYSPVYASTFSSRSFTNPQLV